MDQQASPPTDRSPRPRKRATAESRREELIEAAVVVIGKKGLSNTTLADIAAQAGLGYGNATFRFKTKSALLFAALTHVTTEYVEHRKQAAEAAGDDPAARLDALVSASFDRKVASKKKIALWHAFLSECHMHHSYRTLFAELQESEYSQTRALCEAILAAEGRDDADPHLITLAVSSVVEGLWFNLRLAPNAVNRDEARVTARMILAALFPKTFGAHAATAPPP